MARTWQPLSADGVVRDGVAKNRHAHKAGNQPPRRRQARKTAAEEDANDSVGPTPA